MPNKLGDAIRRLRLAQGLTLAELGEKLGMTGPGVRNWEIGQIVPNNSKLRRLEEIVGRLTLAKESEGSDLPTPPPKNVFGVWLSRARSEAGMSVPELARVSGLSAVAIYNIESGRSQNPQAETKSRLEKALKTAIPEDVKTEVAEEQEIAGLGALTDFDPHDRGALPKVAGVYVFYDISERPVYIGKAANIADRVINHSDKFWFKSPIVFNASYIAIENDDMRHKIEQVLIKFLKSNAVINKQSVDR
ncbi:MULTISPECIES: helix-turn-helix domain-containing protein [Rhodopseudomonas]|uniref:helix-turn-helix domain-containing protein n=1 Tax=Rhodopseudomonas TaxID=1073 RepID=UPI0009B95734|nr:MULTISPECIES: helix-turn-helix domain-containing protein [Rhodopseudomonas]MDF3809413.1 helix-turn-helix domain-containing protein [Rhodopseudomonas sp. BAL398]WOK18572.1 helix-turn-helix domain-containing protein [Rhodopseudomonas sp. BAL398]